MKTKMKKMMMLAVAAVLQRTRRCGKKSLWKRTRE